MLLDRIIDDFVAYDHILGHLAYIFAILSMTMRTMLWLRSFALMSGLVAIVYFGVVRSDYVSAFWEFFYISVNVVQLFLLWFENRIGQFDDDERAFVHDALMDLKPVHAARLVRLARTEEIAPGHRLAEQGNMPARLYYLLSGEVRIVHDGVQVGTCGRGDFIGEMSFLSRAPANASVLTSTSCKALVFERDALAKLLDRREPLRHALHAGVSRNLLAKIGRMNTASVSGRALSA